jgi:pyruvate-formate lyase
VRNKDAALDFEEVRAKLDDSMEWLASLYANTMNIIHCETCSLWRARACSLGGTAVCCAGEG